MRAWLQRNRQTAAAAGAVALSVIATVVAHVPRLGGGEIDWDEGVYWLSMQTMRSGHALFTSVYSSQPPAFLLLTEPPWALLGGGIAAGRAVMLFWGVVAVLAGSVIGWRLGGRVAAVAAAVTLAADPLMVRQALVLQADGPATAIGVLAVATAVIAVTTTHRRWSLAAAAVAGAALVVGLLTKLLDVAVVLPMLAVLAGGGARWRTWLMTAVGAVIAAAVVLLPMHDAWQAMWDQAVGLHLSSRSVTYGLSLGDALRERWQVGAIAAAGAVLAWRRHRRLVIVGVAWVAGSVAAMAATHPLWPHHTVSLSPGYALLVGAGVSTAFAWLAAQPWGRRSQQVGACAAVAMAVFALLYMTSSLRHVGTINVEAVASRLTLATPASAQVLGDEQFAQALANRSAPPAFVDTSNTRLYNVVGDLQRMEATADGRSPVCSVLFSSGRFASLPGFVEWVTAHYPVRITVGPSNYLYTVPGCH